MMTSDYPNPSFSGDFRWSVCVSRAVQDREQKLAKWTNDFWPNWGIRKNNLYICSSYRGDSKWKKCIKKG